MRRQELAVKKRWARCPDGVFEVTQAACLCEDADYWKADHVAILINDADSMVRQNVAEHRPYRASVERDKDGECLVLDAGAAKITIEGPPTELFHAGVDLANRDGGRIEWTA